MSARLSTIEEALDALKAGRPVLVTDDEDRENEGDVILAGATATTEWMAWTIRHTSGYICVPMSEARADRLGLPLMVADNQDPRHTAYTVTVDAAQGVSTGISAADRAHTIRLLAQEDSIPSNFNRPGTRGSVARQARRGPRSRRAHGGGGGSVPPRRPGAGGRDRRARP